MKRAKSFAVPVGDDRERQARLPRRAPRPGRSTRRRRRPRGGRGAPGRRCVAARARASCCAGLEYVDGHRRARGAQEVGDAGRAVRRPEATFVTRASRMRADHAHIVRAMRDPVPPPRMAEPVEPGARRSLRALLRSGPAARRSRVATCGCTARSARRPGRPRSASSAASRRAASTPRAGSCSARSAWRSTARGGRAGAARRPRSRATYLLNTAIKGIFRRARPALEDLPALIATPTALSFPSAHASSSFAAARAYSAMLPAGPLYATAAAMAVSRVYLGVHYPTDIVAGALLGTIAGSAGR